jgi:HD-like signal output (HDOD) protein
MSSMNQPVCHKLAADLIELANATELAAANGRRDEMVTLLTSMDDRIRDLHSNMGSDDEDFADPDAKAEQEHQKTTTPDTLESGSHSE